LKSFEQSHASRGGKSNEKKSRFVRLKFVKKEPRKIKRTEKGQGNEGADLRETKKKNKRIFKPI